MEVRCYKETRICQRRGRKFTLKPGLQISPIYDNEDGNPDEFHNAGINSINLQHNNTTETIEKAVTSDLL